MKFNSTTTFFYDNKNNDFQCVESDDEMKSFLDAKGVKYKQVEIQYGPFKNGRIVYSDSSRRTVSYNGYHTKILYKEKIFDNLFKSAIESSKWVDDLLGIGNKMAIGL